MSELRQAALRGTFWSALQQAGDRGIRILVYLVLARLLAPEAFGLVALAVVFIEFFQLFLNQGLTAAIVQRDELEPAHLDSAFWGNIGFSLLLAALVIGGSGIAAGIAGEPEIEPIIRWLSLAFPIRALSAVQEAVLRRALNFKALAARSLASQVIGGIVALALAFAGFGVWSLVGLELVKGAVGVVVLWTASSWRPRLAFSVHYYRQLFDFGVHIMGVDILGFFRNRADYFLIGVFLGTTPLGFYSIAKQLVGATTHLISGSVGPVMWSTFTRLQAEPQRLGRAILSSTELLALVAWPVYLGGAAVAPELVPVILGAKWTPSVPLVQAFMLASAIRVVITTNMTAITAVGAIRWRVGLEVLAAGLTVAAQVLALPFGVAMVAWAYVGALFALLPVDLWAAFRLLPLSVSNYARCLVVPAVVSVVMVAAIEAYRWVAGPGLSQPVLLGTSLALAVAVYAATLYYGAPDVTRKAIGNLRVAFARVPVKDIVDVSGDLE